MRLFPTEADAKRVEVFTEGNPVNFTSLEAYVLDGRGSGVVGSTTVADRGELWMNGLGHICYAGIPEGTDIHVSMICRDDTRSRVPAMVRGC